MYSSELIYLLASFKLHLALESDPISAWAEALKDYAKVYGPEADLSRLPVSRAAEVELERLEG